jgi:hypothetical protein
MAILYCRRTDVDVPRIHKMKGAAQALGDGFLDRPEQRCGLGQVSARQLQCLVKLLYVEDPAQGIAFLEFGASGHIDADIRLVVTEGGPDFFACRAEGDGRTPVSSQQEMGPTQRIVDYVNRERDSVGEMGAFPKWVFLRPKVFPEGCDEPTTVFHPTGRASGRGCGVLWHGAIKDDAPARNETHGLNEYFLSILCHGCPYLSEPRHGETQCMRIARTCIIVRP